MYDSILVPTDGSDAAEVAARHAMILAAQFDATVHALYVVDDRYKWMDAGTLPAVLDTMEETGTAATRQVATISDDMDADIDVITAVEHGTPSQKIRDYADDQDIDVIVMGSHGRTGVERALLGSVTENTIRIVDTPVLVVK